MPRSTRRIDRPNDLIAEGLNCWCQCPIKNKFLDEFRSLKKGELLLRRFREVLIQVAKKTRVPFRIRESVNQCPRVRVGPAPEVEKPLLFVP